MKNVQQKINELNAKAAFFEEEAQRLKFCELNSDKGIICYDECDTFAVLLGDTVYTKYGDEGLVKEIDGDYLSIELIGGSKCDKMRIFRSDRISGVVRNA